MATPLHLALRPVPRHPQDSGTFQPGERIQQDAQTLARLVAPEEQHSRKIGGHRLGPGEPLHVDPVEEDLVLALARAHRGVPRRFGDGDPNLQAGADQVHQRLEQRDPAAHAGAVIRPHHGYRGASHEPVGGDRRQRLVRVQHVVATTAHELLGAHGRAGRDGHGGDGTVGAQAGGAPHDEDVGVSLNRARSRSGPSSSHPTFGHTRSGPITSSHRTFGGRGSGGGAALPRISGSHHGHLVTHGAQGPCEPEHLALDAAGPR